MSEANGEERFDEEEELGSGRVAAFDRQSAHRGVVAQISTGGAVARSRPPGDLDPEQREEDDEEEDEERETRPSPRRHVKTESSNIAFLPPVPQAKSSNKIGQATFILVVLLPTIVTGIYMYFFAANQYVSEFRFSVLSQSAVPTPAGMTTQNSSSSNGNSATGSAVSSMMSGGVQPALMTNFVVIDYMLSRQVVDELDQRIGLRKRYSSKTSPADWWASLPAKRPTERFVDYWNSMVDAYFDETTGMASVRVRAFTPQDARDIAQEMVVLGEDLVNKMQKRPQEDAVRFAQAEVDRQEKKLKDIRAELAAYRTEEGVIDPTNSVATNVDLAKALKANLLQFQTELAALGDEQLAINAPAAQMLRSRVAATQEQYNKVEKEVNKDQTTGAALEKVVARFEKLNLDLQYQEGMVVTTRQALDQARAQLAIQSVYLTPYVSPAIPQAADYPKRWQTTLVVFLIALLIWVTGLMLTRAVNEHLR